MKPAIIVHGTPEKEDYTAPDAICESNKHWIPWLQKELINAGWLAQAPEMPIPYLPDFASWKAVFEHLAIDTDGILVGHSCGGGFLVRWLSENPIVTKRVVLVAPWLDPFASKCTEFFDFEIDSAISDRTELHLLESDNDSKAVQRSIEILKEKIPNMHVHSFSNYGHFCSDDLGGHEFPELKAVTLGLQN